MGEMETPGSEGVEERTPHPPSAGGVDPGPGYLGPGTCPSQALPPVLSGKVVSKHAHSLELWGRGGLDLVQDHTILPLWSQVHISPPHPPPALPTHCPRQQRHLLQQQAARLPGVPSPVTPSCSWEPDVGNVGTAGCLTFPSPGRPPPDTYGYFWSHPVPFLPRMLSNLQKFPCFSLPSARVTPGFSLTHTEECGIGWGWWPDDVLRPGDFCMSNTTPGHLSPTLGQSEEELFRGQGLAM